MFIMLDHILLLVKYDSVLRNEARVKALRVSSLTEHVYLSLYSDNFSKTRTRIFLILVIIILVFAPECTKAI